MSANATIKPGRELERVGRALHAGALRFPNLSIEWRVLTYHTLHGTGDWGCKIHDVAASLGLDLAKVRSVVAFLEDQGELYSTIDEDHHKYTTE